MYKMIKAFQRKDGRTVGQALSAEKPAFFENRTSSSHCYEINNSISKTYFENVMTKIM